MEYNWDNKDIENDLKKLKILTETETNIKKKCYYLKIIDYTKSIIETEKISKIRPNRTRLETIVNLNSNYKYNERYYTLIEIFNRIIEKNKKILNTTIENYIKIGDLSKADYIDNEHALTIMHDFFKNTDEEIFKQFQILYKNRHNTIKFKLKDNLFEEFGLDGCCTYIDVLRKNYILVKNDEGLSKIINLAYECGHAVANLYNPEAIYNRPDEFLSELPSLFFELAFQHEIAKNIDPFESALFNVEKIDYFSQITNNLTQHKNILKEWERNYYKIDKNLYQKLKEKHKLTRSNVDDSINTCIEQDGSYITGYMTALELLNIYKQDKKSALIILKEILKNGQNDSLEIINTYIPSFKNIETEIHLMETTMNKEITKKIK